jgi:gentisate 1,2-dioxygenase
MAHKVGLDCKTDALYHEYVGAVNFRLPNVPCITYPSEMHKQGSTRVIPLDLSQRLHIPGHATGPSISANYLRICKGESLSLDSNASAQIFYVIAGKGRCDTEYGTMDWGEGDAFTLPVVENLMLTSSLDAALYYVNDAPLLDYLGAKAVTPKFSPTLYTHDSIMHALEQVDSQPGSRARNRDAIILGNQLLGEIKSATHTLWSAFVLVNPGEVQRPHRHNSIAVDIIVKATSGCYTLLGNEVDDNGDIINPQRVDWESGAAFVTPPALWHGHYNESNHPAIVMAAQEAGLYQYLRTLDIRFTKPASGREYKP